MTRSPRGARAEQVVLLALIIGPLLAVLAAIPVAWGWGLGWHDIVIALVMYAISGHGITVGFHRYFTHGAFKAKKALRVALADRREPRDRGSGHPLGRRPPPAPRLQRPRGRPALPVAVRREPRGADQGPVARPHRLDVRRRADQPPALRARPARRPRDRRGSRRRSRGCPPSACCCRRSSATPGPAGPGRAPSPRSSGPAWCGSRCCTT